MLQIIFKMWRHFKGRMDDEGGWIPAAIAAGAVLGGQWLSNQQNSANTAAANAQSARNTASANQANLQIAREQMQFQDRMSSSAYQRAMADMKQAGLNPILAYQQGGASTPSGASATMQTPNVMRAEYQDPLGPAINSAVNAYGTSKRVDQAQEALGLKAGGLAVAQANSTADIALKASQAAATTATAKKVERESQILESRAKKEKLEGDWYDSNRGKTLYELNKINEAVGGTLDSANSAKQLINPFSLLKTFAKPKRGMGRTKDGTTFDLGTGEILP